MIVQVVNCDKLVMSCFPQRLQYQGSTVQSQHGAVCAITLAQLEGFLWVDTDTAYGMSLLCIGHHNGPLQAITPLDSLATASNSCNCHTCSGCIVFLTWKIHGDSSLAQGASPLA